MRKGVWPFGGPLLLGSVRRRIDSNVIGAVAHQRSCFEQWEERVASLARLPWTPFLDSWRTLASDASLPSISLSLSRIPSQRANCPRTTFENGQVTSEGHRSIRDLINWIYTEQCCPLRRGNTNHFPMSSGMGNLVVCYEPLIEFQFDDLVLRFTEKKGFV
ncbi:hypothetical protein V1478_017873 [Vespula squamosa]|uniref:Uncharacterized protein n=1 Tax=Vespula squamosa TaxID=30214 RepID=A0ABD1ZVF7_VESSQ